MRNNRLLSLVDKNRLPVRVAGLYIPAAGVNPSAGFSSLIVKAGSRDISDMRYFYARNSSCDRIMAGRDGEAFAPAGSFDAGLLTLLRLATTFSSVVARLPKLSKEAANMAISTRLQGRTSSHLNPINKRNKPLFVWRFFSGQNSTYLTTTATSEREARLQLPAVHLVFVARIRTEGVNHA
ncbi:TPA: host cell division inhibitor Icd-like protein [Salmonella enterica]|nr:host cell division inhibitor Icd-like protein [Salmonella enterica]